MSYHNDQMMIYLKEENEKLKAEVFSLMKDRQVILDLNTKLIEKQEKTDGEKKAEKLAGLLSNMDGRVWAEVFCEINPCINKEMMCGWFSNAIMVGYDTAMNKSKKINSVDDVIDFLKSLPTEKE